MAGPRPRQAPYPLPTRREVDFGMAELLPDGDRAGGWWLAVGDVPQSYLMPADPTHLEFEYVRWMGDVLDLLAPGPLDVLHLGGGGCTLPRYLAATRPGSRQLVIEADAGLARLVREQLGTDGFRLKVGDARTLAAGLLEDGSDAVVADVFRGAELPSALTTVEWLAEVRRLLRPGGTYVVNLADARPLDFTRGQVASAQAVFGEVLLLGDPGVLRGRRFGNLVLVAGDGGLPVGELARRGARAVGTARVVHGADLTAFRAGARPVTDATAGPTPVPPADIFVR